MNFDLTDEQLLLRESVSRLIKSARGGNKRTIAVEGRTDTGTGLWNRLTELGIGGLGIPETYGGFGGGAVDRLPVLLEFGREMVLEPFVASVVLCGTALSASGDDVLCAEILPSMVSGDRLLAFAHKEAAGRHAARWVETRARPSGALWVLNGTKCNVIYGAIAQQYVVVARTRGNPDDIDGLALFLVDACAPGVSRRDFQLLDGSPASEIVLDSVPARAIADTMDSHRVNQVVEYALDAGLAAFCADTTGGMEAVFRLTVDYLNSRQQFGRPLGQNQALRHRIAEMFVSLELCRSMTMLAAIAVDDPASVDGRRDLVRAKVVILRHARFLFEQAVQVHGGIGMTEEYAVGNYLRRFVVAEQLVGDLGSCLVELAGAA